MTSHGISRRFFLHSTQAGSSVLPLGTPAILALSEAREFEAIAAHILSITDKHAFQ